MMETMMVMLVMMMGMMMVMMLTMTVLVMMMAMTVVTMMMVMPVSQTCDTSAAVILKPLSFSSRSRADKSDGSLYNCYRIIP